MNPLCECKGPGFCPRHQMDKDERLFRNCKGIANNADCGRKYWVSWEMGGLGATAPEDPIIDPNWVCGDSVITEKQLAGKLATNQSMRQPSDGCRVGTRVKSLIKQKYGLSAKATCKCNQRAVEMDMMGCDGCRESFDQIVEWLCEGAAKNVWLKPIVILFGGTVQEHAAKLVKEAIELEEKEHGINPSRITLEGLVTRERPKKSHKWEYGLTTTISRLDNLLPRTLESLSVAGFPDPVLFIDGLKDESVLDTIQAGDRRLSDYRYVIRNPQIKTFGNWILGLYELYIREPLSQLYAMFQDDFVTYPNLRQYLDNCQFPAEGDEKGYWNLYTFPLNQKLAEGVGWFKGVEIATNVKDRAPVPLQRGLGAVALVFCRDAVVDLLGSREHIAERPMTPGRRSWTNIDGGIVSALNKKGWIEYCHNPSLVQHTGEQSSMGGKRHPLAESFRGEDFDARELIT